MDAIALHLELRNALSLSDELGRHEHANGQQTIAAQLAALKTTLASLEREAGQTHSFVHVPNPVLVQALERSIGVIRDRAEEIPLQLRPRVVMLMDAVERIVFASKEPASAVPAKKVAGALPLARVLSQDVHSIGDYAVSAALIASALVAKTKSARVMGLLLGCAYGGVSLATDCRLSFAKVIPIELHEVVDHATGLKAFAAPLVLGYARKDPIAATIQMVAGLGTVVRSLLTDYRAERGIGFARRSKGGPTPRRFPKRGKNMNHRVPEAQRPLEGLAGPSVLPSLAPLSG